MDGNNIKRLSADKIVYKNYQRIIFRAYTNYLKIIPAFFRYRLIIFKGEL